MMRFLRRLRRLGRWAYSLLARRARELPHLRYAYLALVPISLPPLAWGYYPPVTRGWDSSLLDYLAPWLIFSATLVLLLVRGDRPRRKNVRRPLGPKFLWSGIATSEFGLVVLALYPLVSGPGEWLSQIALQAARIVGFVAIAAFLYALAVVLPLMFLFAARAIAPVKIWRWRLGRQASPGNVYAALRLVSPA